MGRRFRTQIRMIWVWHTPAKFPGLSALKYALRCPVLLRYPLHWQLLCLGSIPLLIDSDIGSCDLALWHANIDQLIRLMANILPGRLLVLYAAGENRYSEKVFHDRHKVLLATCGIPVVTR